MARKKDVLAASIKAAKEAGAYMVAVWIVKDGKLTLDRVTDSFPVVDLPAAIKMLKEDLAKLTGDE